MCRTSCHTGPSTQWLNVQYGQYKDNSDNFIMWSTCTPPWRPFTSCTPPWWPFTSVQDYWRETRKFTHSLLSAVCMTTFEQWLHWTIPPWTAHTRCCAKSPTAQDIFQPIPGLINCSIAISCTKCSQVQWGREEEPFSSFSYIANLIIVSAQIARRVGY